MNINFSKGKIFCPIIHRVVTGFCLRLARTPISFQISVQIDLLWSIRAANMQNSRRDTERDVIGGEK